LHQGLLSAFEASFAVRLKEQPLEKGEREAVKGLFGRFKNLNDNR
jgi:hypothetical protein